ncbi:MAG: TonB family protein [Spirochaetota bacterium]
MQPAKTKKQNNRRLGGALMCAALLHIALLAAVEVFSDFPDAPHRSSRGTVTRVQLTPAQVKQEPAPRATKKKASADHEKGQEQNHQEAARPEPTPSKTLEEAPADKPQEAKSGPSEKELIALDESIVSPPQPQSSQSDGKLKVPQAARTQAQRLAQAASRPPARRSTADRAEVEQQEFTVYLQQLIEEKRRYPRAARRRNIEGAVEFSVHVSREGALAELTLNSSSGSRILDKAAEDLLERVFPVDYPLQENVRTTIRIIYKLTEV